MPSTDLPTSQTGSVPAGDLPAKFHAPAAVTKVTTPAAKGIKAVAKTATAAELNLRERWDAIKRNPPQALMDALGSGQRAVGAIAYGIEHGEDAQGIMKELARDVFLSPSDTQSAQARERTTDSIRALLHLATHEAIDNWVKSNVPTWAQGYASSFFKGAEDFGVQTVADPTTYVGIGLAKVPFIAAAKMIQATHFFDAVASAGKAAGLGGLFVHMGAMADASKAFAKYVGDSDVVTFFRTRPELDNFNLGAGIKRAPKGAPVGGFTAEGKQLRMQIEAKANHVARNNRAMDDAAATSAQRTARARAYITNYGSTSHRAQLGGAGVAPGFLSKRAGIGKADAYLGDFQHLTQEEQVVELRKLREDAQNGMLARGTEELVRKFDPTGSGVILKAGTLINDYRRIPSQSQQVDAMRKLADGIPGTQFFRDLMRFGLFLNPFPHGIKNVGQLVYLNGGIEPVMRGFKAMATGKIDVARLERGGSLPSYTEHQLENSVWAKIPGIRQAWLPAAKKMQQAMTHMEAGWRQGLLETADRKLKTGYGDARDELLKHRMVVEHAGDYENQSAFVHMFTSIGGPFVAFRLGIVPKALVKAISQNPERVLAALRIPHDVQINRPGARKNELSPGGPVEDFARFAADPIAFLLSPATSGPLGIAAQTYAHGEDVTPGQAFERNVGEYLNPFGEALGIIGTPFTGTRAGEKETMADRLVDATLATFAVYFHRMKTAKAVRQQEGRERKQEYRARKPLDDFMDALIDQNEGP